MSQQDQTANDYSHVPAGAIIGGIGDIIAGINEQAAQYARQTLGIAELADVDNAVLVHLPEPLPADRWSYLGCTAMWDGHEDADGETGTQVAAMDDGTVELGMARYAPDEARAIAADILAAAAIAEANQ